MPWIFIQGFAPGRRSAQSASLRRITSTIILRLKSRDRYGRISGQRSTTWQWQVESHHDGSQYATRRIVAVTRRAPISYDCYDILGTREGIFFSPIFHCFPPIFHFLFSLPTELTIPSLHTCVESWLLLERLPLLKICKACCRTISKWKLQVRPFMDDLEVIKYHLIHPI